MIEGGSASLEAAPASAAASAPPTIMLSAPAAPTTSVTACFVADLDTVRSAPTVADRPDASASPVVEFRIAAATDEVAATSTAGRAAQRVKALMDLLGAFALLAVLLPVLLVVGVLVATTSRGPALFRQRRVGRDGRAFTMIKFRTMQVDADRHRVELLQLNDTVGGVLFKMHDDPRVTAVGRVLRRLSLDELPQLLNVLTGAMSLVGPRPPLPDEVARYRPEALRRLRVKPGLTGLWQVSGRSNLSWEDSLRLDLRYVDEWTLALDAVVLLKTVGAVLRADGAY